MNNFEELLISYVEQSPHLYNKSLKDYKDEGMKQNTWTSIAIKLESEPEKVKKHWENLRNNFVRAYRTYNEKLPSGSAAVEKKITFPYFRAMLWLAPYIRKEKMTSSYKRKKNIEEASTMQTSTFNEMTFEEETPIQMEAEMDEIFDAPFSPSASSSRTFPSSSASSLSKVKSKKSDLSTAVDAFKTFVDYKTNASTQRTITDPADDAFLQSIILDMGKIKPQYRIQFKCELMKLIYTFTQME
ncbi:hypothetical protein ABEB36_004657 [Hypothenemus hampei]|uniref:MADF domain-containing protein n=1 Tax=Hypothenemus hampei TaxID=57062 RepID=A0ABD1F412_HYPHA